MCYVYCASCADISTFSFVVGLSSTSLLRIFQCAHEPANEWKKQREEKKIVAHRKRMWCKPSENPFHSNSEPSAWVFFYYPSHWYGTCCCIFHDNYLNLFISTFVFISFFLYLCLSFFFVFGLRSCWFFFLLFLQPLQLYDRLVLARFFLSPKHGCRSFLGNSTIESNGIFRCTKALNSMVFSLLSLSLFLCIFHSMTSVE